jgi:hypothetical protein
VRQVCVVTAAALLLALCCGVARTMDLPNDIDRFDFGSQLMLRIFGENSDSSASFAASHGDRASESPLRQLALQVRSAGSGVPFTSGVMPALAESRLSLNDLAAQDDSYFGTSSQLDFGRSELLRFAPPSSALQMGSTSISPSAAIFTAAYQPQPPQPTISPAPGTLAFTAPDAHSSDFFPATAQIGTVRFEAESPVAQPLQLDSRGAFSGAGASFDLRAGKRNVDVNLSSDYEHIGPGGANAFTAPALGSSWQLPGVGEPFVVPAYADLNRLSLGAGLSVPVIRGLTLNLNYGAERLYGGYGFPGLMNLDTMNNSYGGGLTFDIPRTSSSLSIAAYQDRFGESILPINGSTQTREDVNFTVKF